MAEKLSKQGFSVENLSTELRRARNGGRNFVINVDVTSSNMLDEVELQKQLRDIQQLKQKLKLDVLDIRVQKLETNQCMR